jgi:peroxiredoxin
MNLSKMIMTIFGAAAFLFSVVVGQTPQITLKSIDGKTFELSEREGRFVVIYFDGTWNPMVEKTLPALERLSDQFSGRDVDFYWVSINSRTPGEKNYASDQDLRLFAKEMGVSVPVLRDPERNIFRALKLDVIPITALRKLSIISGGRGRLASSHHSGFRLSGDRGEIQIFSSTSTFIVNPSMLS